MDGQVEGAQPRRRGEAAEGSEERREAAEPLREEQRDADDADPRVEAAAKEGGPSDGEFSPRTLTEPARNRFRKIQSCIINFIMDHYTDLQFVLIFAFPLFYPFS